MVKRTLSVVLVALTCVALTSAVFAAPAPAKPAPQFDQEAALQKFWKGPDSAVVGTVNGVKVTKGELMKTLWFWQSPQVLQDMLSQKMIEQAAAKAKVSVTPAELQTKMNENIQRMGAADLKQFINQFRVTKQRFVQGTKLNLLAEKTVQKDISIPDSEYADWIKARHILIKFDPAETDQAKKEEKAKAKIEEIIAKLKAGEDFAKLADQFSEDPSNDMEGKKGGDLGWFTHGRMLQDFEQVAYKLKPGEISEPVKTMYGYHVIKLEKSGATATAAEKAELKKSIMERKVPGEMGRWFQDLQAKSKMNNMIMAPPPKEPTPAMRPPSGRPGPRTITPPPSAPRTSTPPAGAKPDTNTPPPPPPPSE